ncbi:DUF1330 domain-containing protein [Epibacterium ulvae]|uniref:DUF1330 domain-containing protein n=1 Tax=Epibacterium ulvae TaxID=1156985 RepID=UPI0024914144|nr:DUF1330 domain-containing protein [Epibacterium ulvae]
MAFAYVNLIVTNPESLATYREKAGDALARHSGKVVAAAPSQTVLEGDAETGLGVILEFATTDNAKAWIADPDLADVHALRKGAGNSTITLLG